MNRSAKNRNVKMTIAAAMILGSWAYSGANFLAQQHAAEQSSILYAAAMKRSELYTFAMQQYLLARHPGKLIYRVTGVWGIDGDYVEKGTHAGVPYYVHGRYFLYLESPRRQRLGHRHRSLRPPRAPRIRLLYRHHIAPAALRTVEPMPEPRPGAGGCGDQLASMNTS